MKKAKKAAKMFLLVIDKKKNRVFLDRSAQSRFFVLRLFRLRQRLYTFLHIPKSMKSYHAAQEIDEMLEQLLHE